MVPLTKGAGFGQMKTGSRNETQVCIYGAEELRERARAAAQPGRLYRRRMHPVCPQCGGPNIAPARCWELRTSNLIATDAHAALRFQKGPVIQFQRTYDSGIINRIVGVWRDNRNAVPSLVVSCGFFDLLDGLINQLQHGIHDRTGIVGELLRGNHTVLEVPQVIDRVVFIFSCWRFSRSGFKVRSGPVQIVVNDVVRLGENLGSICFGLSWWPLNSAVAKVFFRSSPSGKLQLLAVMRSQ